MKLLFYLLFILFTAKIVLIFAAVPINQLVINRGYCKKDLELIDCGTRVQRKNKTAQEIKGWVLLKKPLTNNISIKAIMSYQDYSGRWKGLMIRYFDRACDQRQLFKDQFQRYIPSMDLNCPIKPGNYTIGPKIINRYRKDWDADMKFWIPPMWMEADNWKAEVIYYYSKFTEKAPIAHVTLEYRLLNERMSQ